jgi:hypothetical protein
MLTKQPDMVRSDFDEKLKTYFEGCQRISNEYMDKHGYERDASWRLHRLKNWVRIENPSALAS